MSSAFTLDPGFFDFVSQLEIAPFRYIPKTSRFGPQSGQPLYDKECGPSSASVNGYSEENFGIDPNITLYQDNLVEPSVSDDEEFEGRPPTKKRKSNIEEVHVGEMSISQAIPGRGSTARSLSEQTSAAEQPRPRLSSMQFDNCYKVLQSLTSGPSSSIWVQNDLDLITRKLEMSDPMRADVGPYSCIKEFFDDVEQAQKTFVTKDVHPRDVHRFESNMTYSNTLDSEEGQSTISVPRVSSPETTPVATRIKPSKTPSKPKFHRGHEPKSEPLDHSLQFCKEILDELQRQKHVSYARYFYEPVDPVLLEIPDYFDIIKHPMDMSTMREKIETEQYDGPLNFWQDFLLMTRNAMDYNPPLHDVHQAAFKLKILFEELWAKKLSREPSTPRTTSNRGTEIARNPCRTDLLVRMTHDIFSLFTRVWHSLENELANFTEETWSWTVRKPAR